MYKATAKFVCFTKFAQCLDAIMLSVMYSIKKVPVTVYDFQTVNFPTPHQKSLKTILIICKKGLLNENLGRNIEYRRYTDNKSMCVSLQYLLCTDNSE